MIDHNKYSVIIGLFLIEWIESKNTIFYKELSNCINYPRNYKTFSKDISLTLEYLGNMIRNQKIGNERVPYIQSLVVNKSHFVPGRGYHIFIDDFDKKNCREIIYDILKEQELVLSYPHWDSVKKEFLNYLDSKQEGVNTNVQK